MSRLRLTIRRMMFLVAIVGMGLATALMIQRSRQFARIAEEQAYSESLSLSYADEARGKHGDRQRVERGELMASYHRALKLKYERAARYPWLSVEPDPPIPD